MKVFAVLLSCVAAATATLDVVRPRAPLSIASQIVQKGDITISREIKSVNKAKGTLTVDHGCTGKDEHGSNNCEMNWGETYAITINAELDDDLDKNTKLNINAKLDGLIPFKLRCAVCGVNCTFTIPIVKKTVTIPFGDVPCPIKGGTFDKTLSVTLPAKDPVPIKVSFTAEVTLTDDSGTTVVDATARGSLSS
jgi:hypothetical protein